MWSIYKEYILWTFSKKKKLEFSLQFFNRNSDKIIPLIILGSQTSKFVCVDSSSNIQVQKSDAFKFFLCCSSNNSELLWDVFMISIFFNDFNSYKYYLKYKHQKMCFIISLWALLVYKMFWILLRDTVILNSKS